MLTSLLCSCITDRSDILNVSEIDVRQPQSLRLRAVVHSQQHKVYTVMAAALWGYI